MYNNVPQEIKQIAKQDFNSVKRSINRKQDAVVASITDISFRSHDNFITATCSMNIEGESNQDIVCSIRYEYEDDSHIYANKTISSVSNSILKSISTSTIVAADEDDAFGFDEFDEESEPDVEEDEIDTDIEEEEVEIEDPEEDVEIEVDNNIEGHYIVECDRCHGIFISALIESNEVVDHISGVCPLCEKESEQYVKWVVKPVEFGDVETEI